ncbi:S1 RNA-binding domain-containing protein 1 [Megalops cyprinoides]|uniref:S1 RNA-binding domain-containing protein 1 n=1 Tax=Megalops cyprinoides TaxID=118141 RepID=UPI0018647FC4|nr:S1 RNA-binding domain-containing protein 1 [Megalops cyprinoides]
MIRRARTKTCYKEKTTDDEDSDEQSQEQESKEEEEEWEPKPAAPKRQRKASGTAKEPAEKKTTVKKPAKPKEPKPKATQKPTEKKPRAPRSKKMEPSVPAEIIGGAEEGGGCTADTAATEVAPKVKEVLKEPKPRAPRKPTEKKPRAPRAKKKEPSVPAKVTEGTEEREGCATDTAATEMALKVKEERLSFGVPFGGNHNDVGETGGGPSQNPFSAQQPKLVKKEEPEDDFTFDEPVTKKLKTSDAPQGKAVRQPKAGRDLHYDLQMNWNPIEVLSEMTQVEHWVCANIVQLFQEENTIPFIVRYRKELINHMDADAVREVQLALEELCTVSKKSQSIRQTLKKEGVLTAELEGALKNCRNTDELEDVYAPYKKGSKLSKARRAKQLGLEPAALGLLQDPQALDLRSWVSPSTEGVSTLEEVATGVEQILADTIAKDKETLTFVRSLCDRSGVTLHSAVSKAALKEQAQQQQKADKSAKPKDIDKFRLYSDFTCNIQRIQHHQILAINRGENLKILTVKVNVPDRVKSEFCRWCVNVRWRPKGYAREEFMKILRDAVEDSYKRLILPLLCRAYRTSLTASAEKESIAMFVRNLRQRLLVCPVRGCTIMGVDPGYRHGCKLAILSPTGQILHTDVVYLHQGGGAREADKLHHLMIKYSCQKIAIGNGTACRETEEFFAGLIARKFFQPLDVSYCIVNEAGASIYSVSPEAVKEMPDLDPNLRSAVSIGRRVQDPLAELVKIDPKHIGIGTYQHDVSQTSLKAALDGVVEECVSFVGVDINICSETLMRHVAGLNAGRARSIAEWREKNGPFVNREQLKLVKGLGPKSFQQCAGFIRINPETFQSCRSDSAEVDQTAVPSGKAAGKKSKGKGAAGGTAQPNPLDQTCIHPESYSIAMKFLALVEGRVEETGRPELKQRVEASLQRSGLEALAGTLGTTPETLQLIVDGLTQPSGFDIRQNFEQADFKRGVVSMRDLQVGAVLTGRVENTTLFGSFVDIGVGQSGLIHKSHITAAKLPEDRRRRSLALGPGERVEVRVLNVDPQRRRIGLDLIRVLR